MGWREGGGEECRWRGKGVGKEEDGAVCAGGMLVLVPGEYRNSRLHKQTQVRWWGEIGQVLQLDVHEEGFHDQEEIFRDWWHYVRHGLLLRDGTSMLEHNQTSKDLEQSGGCRPEFCSRSSSKQFKRQWACQHGSEAQQGLYTQ